MSQLSAIAEQALALVAFAALVGVPGAAALVLVRAHRALPTALVPGSALVLGTLVAAIGAAIQLSLELPATAGLAVHAGLCAVLVVAAIARTRSNATASASASATGNRDTERGIPAGVLVVAALGAIGAWVLRGTVKLDNLYHISVVRKLATLDAPSFQNVNRFADGGLNPTYALPAWHDATAWTAHLTGVDPIVTWTVLPVLVVGIAITTAAGFAQAVLGTRAAALPGAVGWVLMRELYARREVDGDAVLYGAVPGQVTFEVVLPVVLAAALVGTLAPERAQRVGARCLVVAGIAATTLLHANYVPYIAIVGAGYAAWWLSVERVPRELLARLAATTGVVAAASLAFLGALMPVLAQLENFVNASDESRIDYHLATTLGLQHVRGGHLYEMLGVPGLLTLLAAPVVVACWRGRGIHLVAGGLLAIGAVCFLPPLLQLLTATGSLTIGLRINHIPAMLLGPVFAGGTLLLAQVVQRRPSRGASIRALVVVGVAIQAVTLAVGYHRYLPDPPGYAAWLGLVGVLAHRVHRRRRSRSLGEGAAPSTTRPSTRAQVRPRALAAVLVVVVLASAVPAGAVSVVRAVRLVEPVDASEASGMLACVAGPVGDAFARARPGDVVLSEPQTGFIAMALAPVYVVGDYKVWNSPTDDNRVRERLAAVNRFFDPALDDDQRLAVLDEYGVDWVLVDLRDAAWAESARPGAGTSSGTRAASAVRTALGRFVDVAQHEGSSIAALAGRRPDRLEPVSIDRRDSQLERSALGPDAASPCRTSALWRVRAERGGA